MSSISRSFGKRPSEYFVSPAGTQSNATAGGAIGFIPSTIPTQLTGATLIGNTYMFPTYTAMITALNKLVNDWHFDYATAAGEMLRDMGKEIRIMYKGQNDPSVVLRLMQLTFVGGTTDSEQWDFRTNFDTFYFTIASNNAGKIATDIATAGGTSAYGNIASVRLIRT
jgi:hypothetical protein